MTPTGPGQGTFTSGTQTGGRLEPVAGHVAAPSSTRSRWSASPGRFKGKRTTLTRVTVRAPKGARIRVNCKGRGCPYKRKAIAVKLIRVRSLQRTYRPTRDDRDPGHPAEEDRQVHAGPHAPGQGAGAPRPLPDAREDEPVRCPTA